MRDRARHIASFFVIAGFLALNTATSKSGGPYTGPIPVTPADAGLAKVKFDAGPPTIADLPGHGCSAKTDVCRILGDFAVGTTPIDLPTTGSDLWAGYVWGAGTRQPFFVKIQRGYTPSPDPKLDEQVMDDSAAFDVSSESDADAWIAAVKTGKSAPAGNRAYEQATGWSPTDWFGMAKATSGSIVLLTDKSPPHVFLRTSGNRLLVVLNSGKPLKLGKVEAAEWVGEMWKTK